MYDQIASSFHKLVKIQETLVTVRLSPLVHGSWPRTITLSVNHMAYVHDVTAVDRGADIVIKKLGIGKQLFGKDTEEDRRRVATRKSCLLYTSPSPRD